MAAIAMTLIEHEQKTSEKQPKKRANPSCENQGDVSGSAVVGEHSIQIVVSFMSHLP